MTFFDFLAFFIYSIFFYFLFSLYRKKIKDPKIRLYHKYGYWVKVFFCFCYSMFVLYISIGDTTVLFFPEGYHFYKLIVDDPSKLEILFLKGSDIYESMISNPRNIGYFSDESNFFVIKLVAVLSFLCFGKYLVVNLCFALIAFTGIWKLYEFFQRQYPKLHKQIAIIILFLPTLTFWSSGILKDSLSISALGWFTFSSYQIVFHKKKIIINTIIILICLYVFSIVKIYILVAYLPAFTIFLLLKNALLLNNIFLRIFIIFIFIIGSVVGFIYLEGAMQSAISNYSGEDISEGIKYYQENYGNLSSLSDDGSYFSLGVEFDGTMKSLLKVAPAAIIATFFRPYIWESGNISTLLSSLESFAIIIFTFIAFYKVGIFKFLSTILKTPIILYCFIFSMVFALFVGATTLNFGTLVRYKIPAMPFYLIGVLLTMYHNKKSSKLN